MGFRKQNGGRSNSQGVMKFDRIIGMKTFLQVSTRKFLVFVLAWNWTCKFSMNKFCVKAFRGTRGFSSWTHYVAQVCIQAARTKYPLCCFMNEELVTRFIACGLRIVACIYWNSWNDAYRISEVMCTRGKMRIVGYSMSQWTLHKIVG